MVYFEKSQPAPDCLEVEKNKANGDYKAGTVLDKLKNDFKNKCYICEYKNPPTINVEHFKPHEDDKELKFDWNNLFLACGHCNNTKLAKYNNILDCTNSTHNVEKRFRYIFRPFPYENVKIEALDNFPETIETKELLETVYNGTTKLKTIESANIREKLLVEIMEFQHYLCEYFKDTNSLEDKEYYLIKIRGHLNTGSSFTAFKRWIIYDNEKLKEEFVKFID